MDTQLCWRQGESVFQPFAQFSVKEPLYRRHIMGKPLSSRPNLLLAMGIIR